MPQAEGNYYRSLALPGPAGRVLGQWTQDAVDAIAERLRTPEALRAYRQFGPLIYTEMSRRMAEADVSALLGMMADNGVSQAVVVAMDPFVPTADILDICRRLRGLLLPFGSCDPAGEDYLDRFDHLLTLPITGIKFHSDLQRLPLDSPRLHAMLERLAQSTRSFLPVYLHTGDFPIYQPTASSWQTTLPALLGQFPNLTFVCGHSGWDAPRAALRAALAHPNLFLETSWQPPRLIRRLCDKLGPERLLFGSDFPLYSQRRALRNVRAALTEEEQSLVTGGSARRLLRLSAPP